MSTRAPQELASRSQIRRIRGQPGDFYELIFLDQQDRIVVPLTEWYRLRIAQGPASTRNTYGARIHEIALMTVGGYQNEGIAGQAQVMNKGSYGREVKTIYFAHNPRVQEALNAYLEQMRPLHDPESRHRLIDVEPSSPLFLTERGTPYSPNVFYWHWYRHYTPLQTL